MIYRVSLLFLYFVYDPIAGVLVSYQVNYRGVLMEKFRGPISMKNLVRSGPDLPGGHRGPVPPQSAPE